MNGTKDKLGIERPGLLMRNQRICEVPVEVGERLDEAGRVPRLEARISNISCDECAWAGPIKNPDMPYTIGKSQLLGIGLKPFAGRQFTVNSNPQAIATPQ